MAYRRLEQRRADRREKSAGPGPPTRSKPRSTPEGGERQAWTRVRISRTDAIASRLTPAKAGAMGAVWAAVITMLIVGGIVVGAWILGAGVGGILDVMKVSGTAWLATHMIPVSVGGGSISALPLGLAIVPAVVLWRGGRWATRRAGALVWQDVRSITLTGAGVYGTIGLFVATMSAIDDASVEPLYALIGTSIFAVVAFGAGASFEAGLWPTLADRFTLATRRKLKAAGGGLLMLLGGSALVLAISLVLHFGTSLDLLQVLAPGFLGNILLAILGIAYAPNAIIWTIGYVSGPGFAIADGSMASPFAVDPGALPAFPLFAAVPDTAPIWAPIVLIVPLAAGGVAARLANPIGGARLFELAALRDRAVVAGFIAAAVFVLCILSGGSLGSDRLVNIGPIAWQVALATFVLIVVGGWFTDMWRRMRFRSRSRRRIDLRDDSRSDLST